MDEPLLSLEWSVYPEYHWQDWLDARGKPVLVRAHGLTSLESCSAVEGAWKTFERRKKKTGPVLGPVLDSGKKQRKYSPMQREHAALFRNFAELDYNKKAAILTFATEYGLLGLPLQEQCGLPNRPAHFVMGESHLAWAREICLMREALHLAQSRTAAKEARDRAAWGEHGLRPPYRERRRKLDWLFNLHLQRVQMRMMFEPDAPPRLSFAPLTLLAAMWLQLALSIAGDKQFRQCKFCGCLFEISTEQTGFRRHREFCANASCKTQDYRRRKRTALELAKKGVPSRTIAQRIDTKEATVRRWLASSGPRGTGKQ